MRSSPLSYLLQRLLLFILCIRSMTGRGFVWQLMDSASDPSLSAEALMKESMPNFVQPVRTNDRTYFIFTSMRQILAVAHKTKAFRVVEPFLKDNRLSDSGIRSSVFISYEAYASSKYPDYIAFDDWQSTQGPGKGLVVDIEIEHVADRSSLSCKLDDKWGYCVRLSMTNDDKARPSLYLTLQHYGSSHVGLESWASIFKYIRNHWLIEYLGFSSSSVVLTLRIQDGLWYHSFHTAGLLGIGNEDIKNYPNLFVGKYMESAAKKALEIVEWPQVAVGWRIQRQFCPEWNDAKKQREMSRLMRYKETGGFVAGCQTDYLIRQLKPYHNNPVILMLDIFASSGYGADVGIDIGPTQNLRRDIVQSIKQNVRSTIVLSHLQAKSQTLLNAVDPMSYHNHFREMFLTWLEIAVGVQVPHFINAGGHFADAISILRGYRDVTVLPEPKHCLSEYYDVVKDEKTDDDLLDGEK